MVIIDLLDKFSIDGSTALIVILVILLLAIIGYYADKTKFAREKGEKKEKNKVKKEDIAAVGINDMATKTDNIENVPEAEPAKVEEPVNLFTPQEEAQINEQIEESINASINEVAAEMNKPAEPMVFDEAPKQEEIVAYEETAVETPAAEETTPVETIQEVQEMSVQPEPASEVPVVEEQQPVLETQALEEVPATEVPTVEETIPVETIQEVQEMPVQPEPPVETEVPLDFTMTFEEPPAVTAEQVQAEETVPPTMSFEEPKQEEVGELTTETKESIPEELFAPLENPTESTEELFVAEQPTPEPKEEPKASVLEDDFGINDLPTLKVNKESNDNLAVDDLFNM